MIAAIVRSRLITAWWLLGHPYALTALFPPPPPRVPPRPLRITSHIPNQLDP